MGGNGSALRGRGFPGQIDVRMTTSPGVHIFDAVDHFIDDCAFRFDSIYCVVDLHAITFPYQPAELAQRTREMAIGLLAAFVFLMVSMISVIWGADGSWSGSYGKGTEGKLWQFAHVGMSCITMRPPSIR